MFVVKVLMMGCLYYWWAISLTTKFLNISVFITRKQLRIFSTVTTNKNMTLMALLGARRQSKQQYNLSETLNFVIKVLLVCHLLMSYFSDQSLFSSRAGNRELYKQKCDIWGPCSAHRDNWNSKIICMKSEIHCKSASDVLFVGKLFLQLIWSS